MQARYYDPLIGRFYSTDPVGYEDQLNLYAYVANDPVNKVDPTGMCGTGSRLGDDSGCKVEFDFARSQRGTEEKKFNIVMNGDGSRGKTYTVNNGGIARGESAATDDPSGFKEQVETYANVVTFPIAAPAKGGLVIGKLPALSKLRAGESTLLKWLPDLGSPKANWAQNASRLREVMRMGQPIRDASVNARGQLINNTGFLRAERNLLENRGWTYNPETTMWYPPG